MAPEQARGKAVDRRADIWAFGCLLYEMVTGRVAFRGEDVSEILASVIKGDVKLDLLPTNLHPRVREAVSRCLQRDLNRRYQDIREARYEIDQALADPNGVLVQPVAAGEPRKKLRVGVPWLAAAIVLSLIIAGAIVWNLKPLEPRQVIRFEYELPEGQQLNGTIPLEFLQMAGNSFTAPTKDFTCALSTDLPQNSLLELRAGQLSRFFHPMASGLDIFLGPIKS